VKWFSLSRIKKTKMKRFLLLLSVVATTCTFAQVPNYVPTNGLVGWWPFNGNASDESGNGNNGTVNGATLTTDRFGVANLAYYYSSSGCNTRIDFNLNTSSITSGLTISIWIMRSGIGCISPRFFEFWPGADGPGQSYGWWGTPNPSNLVGIGHTTSDGTVCSYGFPAPSDNIWSHLVYTNDGTKGRYYQDGIFVGEVNSSGSMVLASSLALGRMNHPSYDAFNGKLDDFGIWNRALTQQEITNLYTSSVPPTCSITTSESAVCSGSPVNLQFQSNVPTSDTIVIPSILTDPLIQGSVFEYSTTLPVSGWQTQTGGWLTGNLPFIGYTTGTAPGATNWPLGSTRYLRKTIDLTGYNLNTIQYFVAVDNGYSLYVNGTLVNSNNQGGPATEWEYTGTIPSNLLVNGINYIAFIITDDGAGAAVFNCMVKGQPHPAIYSWSPGGATTPSITVSPTSTTTYTCTVTTNGQSCSSSQTIQVLQPVITTTSTAICSGQSTTLTAAMPVSTACPSLNGTLTNGLVGYWPFCGNANDASGNGNNGTVNGATLTTDRFGNANSAYSFDGVDDAINISHQSIFNMGNNYTVNSWFNVQNYNSVRTVINKNITGDGKNDYFNISVLNGSGILYLQFGNGIVPDTIGTNYAITTGIWHNVSMIMGDSVSLYLDGVLIGKKLRQINPLQNTNPIAIGQWINQGIYFHGKIDDITIYNRSLSQSEIQQLYNQGQTSYLWSNGATTASITVSPTQTITYSCEVTVNVLTCSDDVTVTVLQPTASNIQPTTCSTYTAPDGSVYTSSGTYQVIIPNARGCDSTITINLTVNNPTTSVIAPTTCSTYTAPNGAVYTSSGTYQAIIPNAQGCDSTITINLTVNNPTTSVIAPTVCSTYTAPDGSVYTSSGTYQAIIANAQGCDSTITIYLTVNSLPAVGAGNDLSVCVGDEITLSGSGASSYIWDNGVNNGVPFTEQGTMTYTVTGTDGNNCSNSDQVTVMVNTLPTIDAGSDQVVCEGDPVTLSATGGDSYNWDNGVTNSTAFTPTQTGDLTYSVTGTDANNCSNTDQVVITVNEHSSATQTQSAQDSYTWPVNGQTYTQSGTYTAVIPNAAGCDSTITLNLTLSFAGISENGITYFTVYPNPANEVLNVVMPSESNSVFILLDSRGRKVLEGELNGAETQIDLKALSNGAYILKIGEEKVPIRVIKE
jgi:hypothetical protein